MVVISIVVAIWCLVWNAFSTTIEIIISIVVVISIVVATMHANGTLIYQCIFFFSGRFRYPSCPSYFGGRNRCHQRCHGVPGSQHSSGRLLGNWAGGRHIGLRFLSHPQQVRVTSLELIINLHVLTCGNRNKRCILF